MQDLQLMPSALTDGSARFAFFNKVYFGRRTTSRRARTQATISWAVHTTPYAWRAHQCTPTRSLAVAFAAFAHCPPRARIASSASGTTPLACPHTARCSLGPHTHTHDLPACSDRHTTHARSHCPLAPVACDQPTSSTTLHTPTRPAALLHHVHTATVCIEAHVPAHGMYMLRHLAAA